MLQQSRQTRWSSAHLALLVGLLGSVAANTAWSWEHGPVRVVAGVFATALVPVGMHLWPRIPVTGKWSRLVRLVAMAYICGAAAVVNLVHAVWLLVGHVPAQAGEHPVLAFLLVTAIESVMVMASLALRKPARVTRPATGADLVKVDPAPTPPRRVVAAEARPVQVSERVPDRTPGLPDGWKYSPDTWVKAVDAAKDGAGRPTLIREHGISDPAARKVLAAAKGTS